MKITTYSMQGGFAASPVLVLASSPWRRLFFGEPSISRSAEKRNSAASSPCGCMRPCPELSKRFSGPWSSTQGLAPESFNINNFAPTNLGAFLNPLDTNPALYKLATALDFTTIWSMVLLGIGIAIVAGVKRSSGYIAVFGWWAIIVICTVGWAGHSWASSHTDPKTKRRTSQDARRLF